MLDAKLTTFLEVSRLGSYTRAADALHLTQPAVTQHIHKLERHYQSRLVDTTGRGVRLTEAGERVLEYALLQQANEQRLRERLGRGEPPLRVGATLSIADYYLPESLSPYLKNGGEAPHVEVGNTEALLSRLKAGELDCALIEGLFDEAVFEASIWRSAEFVAVARVGHPLAGKPCELADLCRYPLLLREAGSGTRAVLESALFQRGLSARSFVSVVELGSFGLIKAALCATDAVSFMYERVCAEEKRAGKLQRLQPFDFALKRPLFFLYRQGGAESARCRRFLAGL